MSKASDSDAADLAHLNGAAAASTRRPRIDLASSKPRGGRSWPEPIGPQARIGVVGDWLDLIERETESDPSVLLLQLLNMVGNAFGRAPYYQVERSRHHTNFNVIVVGPTSAGRKGTSLGHVRAAMNNACPEWSSNCIKSGLVSGTGLAWHLRDRSVKVDKRGKETVDEGVKDKRLLVIEAEFVSVLRGVEREGNDLSAKIRDAFDSGTLASLSKTDPYRATGCHLSIIGHITPTELRRRLSEVEASNGFGNRFLFGMSRRARVKPHGGCLDFEALAEVEAELERIIAAAWRRSRLTMDREARALWSSVYEDLSSDKPGLFGSMTARGIAFAIRLALIYALLAEAEAIGAEHLRAALEVWRYSVDSARYLFGQSVGSGPADEIRAALREAGAEGLSRSAISNLFSRNKTRAEVDEALQLLVEAGLAESFRKRGGGRGRPPEWWRSAEDFGD